MKKGIFWFACLTLAFNANAQQAIQKCGSVDVINLHDNQHPGYKQQVVDAFNATKHLADANKANRAADDTIYVVQCVFHVVYIDSSQNIPDSVIHSQIEVLNEDYRRLNDDTVRTRSIFSDIVGDSRIQFELASVDPNGNPTNGITRTLGAPVSGFPFLGNTFMIDSDDVKSAERGGVNPWPTDRYLNVWVCEVMYGFGLLGYAFPPTGAINWPAGSETDSSKQGVVLYYPVVGRNYANPIDATVARGRTAVHEIGHYLGLRHIWGDGPCGEDDGLEDTPDAADANQQTCDTTLNTCTETGSIEYPDMIENYMDYSDDRCLNAFTHDQIAIMRTTLQTSRYGIARRINYADSVSTSIKNAFDNSATVSVYPVPASGVVNFDIQMPQGIPYTVDVYNALGEVVLKGTSAMSKNGAINLSDKPNGVYYAKFSVGTQTVVKRLQIIH